jgi:hypothetical protein
MHIEVYGSPFNKIENKKYHTVRTVPMENQQNTTLSGQFQ